MLEKYLRIFFAVNNANSSSLNDFVGRSDTKTPTTFLCSLAEAAPLSLLSHKGAKLSLNNF